MELYFTAGKYPIPYSLFPIPYSPFPISMYKAFRSAALLLAIVLLSGCNPQPESDGKIILNGNVDDREVNAAFLVSERIAAVHVEEGAAVKKGDLLAELETIRIENRIAEAQAAVDSARTNVTAADAAIEAAQAALDKAVNGNRKEDIDLARAGVEVFDAQIRAAENLYERNKKLSSEEGVRAVSQQDLDNAESNFKKLVAERKLAQTNLEKMLAGSRKEDIAAAKAALEQAKAQKETALASVVQAQATLAIQKQILADSKLLAPCDGVVRSRILEPGEMASPQISAFIIAVTNPKWVRVYLNETLLAKVKISGKATIRVDGLPDKTFDGWIGYISPTAEFTPKNVETQELRTSLVYEVRVYVNDPEGILKLGAPATVEIN